MPRGKDALESPSTGEGRISESTISRMRWYLHILEDYARRGIPIIASHEIAGKIGMKSGLVRKDLCQFGGFGRPSVGYNVTYLQKKVREILRIDEPKKMAWVGADHFACDPSRVKKFAARGCIIAAVFDSSPDWIGKSVGDLVVLDAVVIERTLHGLGVQAAIITCSQENAQDLVNQLAAGGVRAILNLSPVLALAPPGVLVRNMDVAGELLTLCFLANDSQEAIENDII